MTRRDLLTERDRVLLTVLPAAESFGRAGEYRVEAVIKPALTAAVNALVEGNDAEVETALQALRGIQ